MTCSYRLLVRYYTGNIYFCQNLNNLLDDATQGFRFINEDLIQFFKNTTLQNTIFFIGINEEVEALINRTISKGHDPSPLQAGERLIQQLTDKVNSTLYSTNQIPSDHPDFQDHILENQIGMINAVRCNQLMPAIGAFWNNTANILNDLQGQIQDLSGPLFCEKFDPDTDSYSTGWPLFIK